MGLVRVEFEVEDTAGRVRRSAHRFIGWTSLDCVHTFGLAEGYYNAEKPGLPSSLSSLSTSCSLQAETFLSISLSLLLSLRPLFSSM